MPYRHAHYWLLLLFPLTALAFWRNYFSVLPDAPYALHVHGATASLWIGLLVLQSWTIHGRRNDLHRSLGIASLALFPFFVVGGLLVIQTMAAKYAAGSDPFYAIFAPRLASLDLVASVAILYLYFMALKCRRKVHPHARYMLATVFFLLSPIIARLLPILPPLAISGPEDLHRFAYGVQIANGGALLLALYLYARAARHGRPWLLVAGVIGVQMIVFETLARTAVWERIFASFATLPTSLLAALGFAVSVGVAWAGWTSAPLRRAPVATA